MFVIWSWKKSCIDALSIAMISKIAGTRTKRNVGPGRFFQQDGRSHQKRQEAISAEAAMAFSTVTMLARGVKKYVSVTPRALRIGTRRKSQVSQLVRSVPSTERPVEAPSRAMQIATLI